ncbi:MAG: acyltransferase family protein, partial [Patescibacteria group bacterium]
MEVEGISVLILSIVTALYFLFLYRAGLIPSKICLNTDIYINKPKVRKGFFDFSKGIAILAVIIIHTVFIMNAFSEDLSVYSLQWNEGINRVMRFAIPVFFISSGALLFLTGLDKESLKDFYLPKIKRIFIPYVFFSFFATSIDPEGYTGLLD